MKFKYFKERIQHIVEIYDAVLAQDLRLEKALGGDSYVVTTDIPIIVDKMVDSLSKEMEDKNNYINDLMYDHLLRTDYREKKGFIIVSGKKIKATPKSVFKILAKN